MSMVGRKGLYPKVVVNLYSFIKDALLSKTGVLTLTAMESEAKAVSP